MKQETVEDLHAADALNDQIRDEYLNKASSPWARDLIEKMHRTIWLSFRGKLQEVLQSQDGHAHDKKLENEEIWNSKKRQRVGNKLRELRGSLKAVYVS